MSKKEPPSSAEPVNKSKAIRELLTADAKADSKTIIAQLAAKGVKVSPTMVYYVRSKMKQAKQKAKRDRVAESSRQSGAKNPIELVIQVKNLAHEVGGIAHLKQLVDLLAE